MLDIFGARPDYGAPPSKESVRRVYDVCIVGSGASGAVAAYELVRSGLSVVMLEQGPFVSARTSYSEIVRLSEPAYVRVVSGWALTGFPWTTCNVGGGTVFYGGASFRYREIDFDASRFMPEAELPVAWPYDYAELEPYYDEVERMIGIAADPSLDPTSPPTPNATYLPPIEPSPAGRVLRDGGRARGLSPFPTPLAIATVPYRGRPACTQGTPCVEFRCEHRAKGDVVSTLLEPLLSGDGDFELHAGMRAAKLSREQRDRVTSVTAIRVDTGEHYEFRARHFMIACSAVESAALLLRSADRFTPAGLGNERDMVGRGLCFKAFDWVNGWRDDPEEARAGELWTNNGPFSTVSVTDYYLDPAAPGGLGGLIYEARHGVAQRFKRGEIPVTIECILADIPARDNRVRLVGDCDGLGLPRTAIAYEPHPKDLARLDHMTARCEELLRAGGCRSVRRAGKDPRAGSSHLHGTCRGGDDPATSVVDGWSRVHDLANLYVIDGAFMPFPGGVNPTLTIQAHALRAARALARSSGSSH
jgi:choline dehydrogenase-like flavoprotein